MKIIKTANYKKQVTSGIMPGEDDLTYYVRQVTQQMGKGMDFDTAMTLADVPQHLYAQVQQQVQGQLPQKPLADANTQIPGAGGQQGWALPV